MFPHDKIKDAATLYERVVKKYDPYIKIALVSGGDDSMTLIEVIRMIGSVDYVVHVDTTTGLQATQEHVYNYCNVNRLPLLIARTPEETFEEIALEYGFPGPGQHGRMYIRLKERALRVVQRSFQLEFSFCRLKSSDSPAAKRKTPLIYHPDYPDNDALVIRKGKRRIMYFTGARKDESIRRMGTVKEVNKEGNQIWVNLIHNFTKSDIYHIQQQNKVVRNPASILIDRSGECNDGSFGTNTELQLMTALFPKDQNVKMLNRVQAKLTAGKHRFCQYGHGLNNRKIGSTNPKNTILCSSCINNTLAI